MGGVHALIGAGEGLITAGALAFIYASRRDMLEFGQDKPVNGGLVWVFGLLVALGLSVASPLASAHPDGLEWVAEQKGFLNLAQNPVYRLLPDYAFPGVSSEALATILAGILGTLVVFAAALGVAYTRRNHSSTTSS
jgi:cobalt/nickel transport system permease protein